ncbi:MAG: hypothetical protein ACI8W7_004263 [Gammaproteobacteria bacterium]|jgi:uncharacterized protein
MTDSSAALIRLQDIVRDMGTMAVAVSGGVDSMTLAVVAHRVAPQQVRMIHAVSAAVPTQATERVNEYARREQWRLQTIDAGEFSDPQYRANPANRCYFCKTNLYGTMTQVCQDPLVSGTNVDDLGDYRPGLQAATAHQVRHPYVEAGITKALVRAIAHSLDLTDLAELPSAPCLSSRIETGISIDPRVLPVVNDVERLLDATLSASTVRCRVRHQGVVIELDEPTLEGLGSAQRVALTDEIKQRFAAIGHQHAVFFESYRMGSAFVRPATNA